MELNRDQIRNLVRQLTMTQEHEINCNECLDELAEFAEYELAGKSIPDALKAVEHHLILCTECGEEYAALLRALKRMRNDKSSEK
jgi:uncharacterized protein with PIN domain